MLSKSKRALTQSFSKPQQQTEACSPAPPAQRSLPSSLPEHIPRNSHKPLAYELMKNEEVEDPPMYIYVSVYLNYLLLIIFGHLRDIFGKRFRKKKYQHLRMQNGYAPLTSDFESFYIRRLYLRVRDCYNRPIRGVPGRTCQLLDRTSSDYNVTFQYPGTTTEVLNLGSYNYLGFAQAEGPCADAVEEAVRENGIASSSPRLETGTSDMHRELEELTARFLGKEDAIVISMGHATNATTLPALVGKGCLVLSDELNHASIITGLRLSGASIRIFKHNDMKELRELLRESISQGQPRTHRPWKKILVVVEGIYSMEGNVPDLHSLIELKREFKFYIFLDEAHSIGALGSSGRGVCDLLGVDTRDIDIMMGTYTKSFGAAGGYIAADKDVIDYLRLTNYSNIYAEGMSIPVLQQSITSFKIIMNEAWEGEGEKRIRQLRENSLYFQRRLKEMGFILYGFEGSPVIPLLLFNPAKIPAFSRELLKRGIAVVISAYPATPMNTPRVRFCMSSAHTRKDLDYALEKISEVGDLLMLKLSRRKLQYSS
ncbi:uncharacterized protein VTP21DRAFT_9819 [Calcarisporiella thermophila]|uniref:uncharacterized protein n=1 Tax=Calcarisporiella thermophila TaxID=911321 RepID=UPI0037423894